MATGFGVPEIEDSPGVWVGTTPEDIQIITAAEFENPGILKGAEIKTRADWVYEWTDGAVIIQLAPGRMVRVPVKGGTLTPPPAPTTGSRTDTLYVEQLATASSNLVRVVITANAAPAGTVILGKRRVPAGATRASETTETHDRIYARATQSTQGRLASIVDPGGDVRNAAGGTYERCNARFEVNTDRYVNIKLSTTISRTTAAGGPTPEATAATWGSVLYSIYVDGQRKRSFERPFNRMWSTHQFETIEEVAAGAHTVHVTSKLQWDGDTEPKYSNWTVRYGGANNHPGDALTVFDAGVRK